MFIHYQLLNELHAGDYDRAVDLLHTAESKKQLNNAMIEQWQIIKGFLQVISDAGLTRKKVSFRISKFFNEIPIFSKDRCGNAINITSLKVLLDLASNKARLIDNFDAIKMVYARNTSWFTGKDFHSNAAALPTLLLCARIDSGEVRKRFRGIERIGD